jgi:Niemann-Pick C1 protein
MEVVFMAERSIPDDLVLQNQQNMFIVILSYVLMFVYVSLALGYLPSILHSRFILGFSGVMVVILSIVNSVGILAYFGVKITLISSEVVPFLILAIGVDNMFIIVRSERDVKRDCVGVGKRLAKGLGNVGPSIFTAVFCEFLTFLVGMMTDIPALQSFCLLAALSVLMAFILQITTFVAMLAIVIFSFS